jgi:glycosyltransferase involved in cell wall biosynthesis
VLQLGAVPPPYGGVQVNLMAIRAYLRQRGDRASAINLTGNRQTDHDDLYFPRSAWDVLRLIARLKPDVLHLHIGGHLPWRLLALGALCTAWPRAAAVLTLHSGGYPTSPEGRRLTPASAKARVLQRFDRVIAVNQEIGALFARCGVASDRIHVVSPYANERPHDGPLPDRLERFLATHAPVLMTIGLLEPEYDLTRQIDVVGALAQTHPGIGLVIVGSGSLDGALRERLARTPWRDRVLLYGDLEHQMTLAALRRADVFLRTTTYDGDALSVREALALGIPVVATRTALRPPGVRLVDVGDAGAVEAEIRVCLAEPRERRVAEPGSKSGATPDNIATVVRLYDEALGPPSMRSIREASAA